MGRLKEAQMPGTEKHEAVMRKAMFRLLRSIQMFQALSGRPSAVLAGFKLWEGWFAALLCKLSERPIS